MTLKRPLRRGVQRKVLAAVILICLSQKLYTREYSRPQNFKGFSLGAAILRDSTSVGLKLNSPSGYSAKLGMNPEGVSVRGIISYGYEFSGFFVGAEGHYQHSWSDAEETISFSGQNLQATVEDQSGFGAFFLLGQNFGGVLPYGKAGYVWEKLKTEERYPGSNLEFEPVLVGAFSYGLGIKTKLAPQLCFSIELMWTANAKESRLSVDGQELPLSRASIKMGNSLGASVQVSYLF